MLFALQDEYLILDQVKGQIPGKFRQDISATIRDCMYGK